MLEINTPLGGLHTLLEELSIYRSLCGSGCLRPGSEGGGSGRNAYSYSSSHPDAESDSAKARRVHRTTGKIVVGFDLWLHRLIWNFFQLIDEFIDWLKSLSRNWWIWRMIECFIEWWWEKQFTWSFKDRFIAKTVCKRRFRSWEDRTGNLITMVCRLKVFLDLLEFQYKVGKSLCNENVNTAIKRKWSSRSIKKKLSWQFLFMRFKISKHCLIIFCRFLWCDMISKVKKTYSRTTKSYVNEKLPLPF